jgi:Cu/Ag efflux protein CusF
MRKQAIAVAIASAFTFVGSAFAQQRMEAVVTVTKFDPASRMVWVEAKNAKRALHLSPDIDMSNIQVGSRYQLRWTEGVATAIEPGAQAAAAGATREVDIAKTGPGMSTASSKLTGVIDSMDASGKKITLRTPDGEKETFSMGANVAPGSFKTGDTVTLTYERALASQVRSTPQPVSDPAPAQ